MIGRIAGQALVALISLPLPSAPARLDAEAREALQESLEPGDVVLRRREGQPGWDLYETLQFGSARFQHVGIYEGNGQVLHATPGEGVSEVPAERFLLADEVAVLRPRYGSEAAREAVLEAARSKLGTPYDPWFQDGAEGSLYCAEYVRDALAQGGIRDVPRHRSLSGERVGPDQFHFSPSLVPVDA